jgi:glucosamine--fructose-6-phosphate aminotransferase (isomerizing)
VQGSFHRYVVGSSIAKESDYVLYTWAGPEIAVATTKAYSTQLSCVYLIGLYMADMLGRIDEETYKAYLISSKSSRSK